MIQQWNSATDACGSFFHTEKDTFSEALNWLKVSNHLRLSVLIQAPNILSPNHRSDDQ